MPDTICPHCGGTGRKPFHGGCVVWHGRNIPLPRVLLVDDLPFGGGGFLSMLDGNSYPTPLLRAISERTQRAFAPQAQRMQEAFEIFSMAAEVEPCIKRILNIEREVATHPAQKVAHGNTVRTHARVHGRKHKAPRVQRKVIKR